MAEDRATFETLKSLIAEIVGCDGDDIEETSDFFSLGGDSVGVMQLATKARDAGLKALTIPALYEHTVISEMIKLCASSAHAEKQAGGTSSATDDAEPRAARDSTSRGNTQATRNDDGGEILVEHWKLINACTSQLGIAAEDIEDVYEGTLGLQVKASTVMFEIEFTVKAGEEKDVMRAIEKVYQSDPMLRTRLIKDGEEYKQVVVKNEIEWTRETGSLDDFRICNQRHPLALGQRMARFNVVTDGTHAIVIWTASHAHMDRFAKESIIHKIVDAWREPDATVSPAPSIKPLIKLMNDPEAKKKGVNFWLDRLRGLERVDFLHEAGLVAKHSELHICFRHIKKPSFPLPGIAYSTICQLAWGLAMAKEAKSRDLFYLTSTSGRQVPDMDLDLVTGMLLAHCPLRITLEDPQQPLKTFLQNLQKQVVSSFPYEHFTEPALAKELGTESSMQSIFNFSHQPRRFNNNFSRTSGEAETEKMNVTVSDYHGWPNPFASIYIGLEPKGKDEREIFCINDNSLVPDDKKESLLDSLVHNIEHLTKSAPWDDMVIGDVWPDAYATSEKENDTEKRIEPVDPTTNTELPRTLANVLPAKTNKLSIIIPEGAQQISLTQSQLRHCIQDFRVQLAKLKLPTSSAIILAFGNSVEFIVSFLGITWSRYISAPVNPALKEQEIDFYAKDIDAKLVILPKGGYEASSAAALSAKKNGIAVAECYFKESDIILDVKERPDQINGTDSVSNIEDAKEDDVALILHTSGTTGRPKAVPLSHRNLFTSAGNVGRTYNLTSKDRTVLIMPLYHIHGIVASFLSTLSSGGTIILPQKLTPSFWSHFTKHGATWYTATPTMHHLILQFDAPTKPDPRFIRSCSSALSPALFHRLEETYHCPVLESYAMTEASHLMASNPLPPARRLPGCVGIARGVELEIRTDKGEQVASGEEGEICIRGANVTTGYLNNTSANQSAFFDDGFFRTGDQGKLDEDGYLTLTGRLKEFINKGGEKISPIELDNVITQHADVDETVCFAIEDDTYGQDVGAAVRPKKGKELDVKALRKWIVERVAAHKVPRKIWILDEIPKTATGKVQRKMVAEKVKDM